MNTLEVRLNPVNTSTTCMSALKESCDTLIPARSFLDGYLIGLQSSREIALAERNPNIGKWRVELTNQTSGYFYMSRDEIALNLTKLVDSYLKLIERNESRRKYDILIR